MFVQLHKEFMGRKVGERIDMSEADANALVAQQIASPVTDDLITPAVQRAMEQAIAGFQRGRGAVINASLKSFQDAQAKSRRHAIPAIFGENGDGDTHGRTFGDWLVHVAILGSTKTTPQAKAAAQDHPRSCPFDSSPKCSCTPPPGLRLAAPPSNPGTSVPPPRLACATARLRPATTRSVSDPRPRH
jgi:hypothetical protein